MKNQIFQRSRLRSAIFSFITIGVGLLISFALVEFGARYFLYSNIDHAVQKQFDTDLGWIYRPGHYQVKPLNSLIPHEIYISEHGLRVNSNSGPVSNESAKVLVLGDSFTFAAAVPQQDIYTTQLERILNEKEGSEDLVINAGVEGYGTAQQLILLRRLADHDFVGDLIVLQVFTNDILDNLRMDYSSKAIQHIRPGFVLDNEGKLELKYRPVKNEHAVNQEDFRRSLQIVQVSRTLIESYLQSSPSLMKFLGKLGAAVQMPRVPGLVTGWYDNEVLAEGVPLMKEIIREIAAKASAHQARLLVMFIPSPLMVYPETYGPLLKASFPDNHAVDALLSDPARSQVVVQQICEELDIPLLDLYPILLKRNDKTLYFPREGHLTSDGHFIVANALAEKIRVMRAN